MLLSDVTKRYVIANKTIDGIIDGNRYELSEIVYMGAYIINESGERKYYKYTDFNFC